MYYNMIDKQVVTQELLDMRGLSHESVDLESVGIYKLSDNRQSVDNRFCIAVNERVEGSPEKGFCLVCDSEMFPKDHIVFRLNGLIAEQRWKEEERGIEWSGYSVSTTRDSQSKIASELVAIDKGFRTSSSKWKMADGKQVEFTNEKFIEMARSVHTHVATMFNREAKIAELIEAEKNPEKMIEVYEREIDKGWGRDDSD